MGFRSLLRQALQVSGSATYDDTLSMGNAETYINKSLEGDLNYMRSQLKVITGETNWYDAPANSIADIDAGMSGAFVNIQSFTGQDDITDSTPAYDSATIVTQGASLEDAIGQLDAELNVVSGSTATPNLQDVTDAGATTTNAVTVNASGSIFTTLLATDNLHVGGNILVDGTVDGVTVSTFASNVFSFTGMDDENDGSPTYSSTTYVTNGDDLETAISKLDAAIIGVAIVKEVELTSGSIAAEEVHTIPNGQSYTVAEGDNMDLYYNGQLLQADIAGQTRDYEEASTTSVKFHFTVPEDTYITYVIRK